MSVITYNGISLPYPTTTVFNQTVMYDEKGNTDWYCTRFEIRVTAVLNANYLHMMAPAFASVTNNDNAAEIMKRIRVQLLQPRRTLSFKCNGIELIPAASAVTSGSGGTVDVANGPKPQSCSIIQLTTVTFLIQYHIIAHYWENNTTNTANLNVTNSANGSIVLYNRWTETVNIDNCMATTRTRAGKYVIRSDNREGKLADMVRNGTCVMSVPEGFLRKTQQYTVTADGLGIEYEITDEECFKVPPPQAFEAEGEVSRIGSRAQAIVTHTEINLMVKGAKDRRISPQNDLMDIAVAIAVAKLDIGKYAIVEAFRVSVGMWNNVIRVSARARRVTEGNKKKGNTDQQDAIFDLKVKGTNLTFTPFCEDRSRIPNYTARGTASMLLQAAAYWDPNFQLSDLGPGQMSWDNSPVRPGLSQYQGGLEVGKAGITREGQ